MGPYPKNIRREREHYAKRELRFHITVSTHPEVGVLRKAIAEVVWGLVMDERGLDRVGLYAACLMPDHLHLLVGPERMDIITFMNAWKSLSTRRAWGLGHRAALWQPGYWDRTIVSEEDFGTTAEYIVRNPVVAGLVEDAWSWPRVWAWYRK